MMPSEAGAVPIVGHYHWRPLHVCVLLSEHQNLSSWRQFLYVTTLPICARTKILRVFTGARKDYGMAFVISNIGH